MRWSRLLLLVALGCWATVAQCQSIRHFTYDWQTFDDQQRLQPVVLPAPGVESAHLYLRTEGLETFALRIPVQAGTSLWVGRRLRRRADSAQVWVVPIDSLALWANSPTLWLTLHHPLGHLPLSETGLIDPFCVEREKPQAVQQIQTAAIDPIRRHQPYRDSLLVVLVLLVLGGFATVKLYRAWTFRSVFDFRSYVSAFGVDPRLFAQGFVRNMLLLALLPALAWGLCWVLLHETELSSAIARVDLGVFLWPFLRQALVVYSLLVFKLVLLRFLCGFLGENDLYERHYFEFLRALSVVIAAVMTALVFTRVQGVDASTWLPYAAAALCLVVLMRLAWVIGKHSNLAGLYLFSYLCTTEAFPLLIAWRGAF